MLNKIAVVRPIFDNSRLCPRAARIVALPRKTGAGNCGAYVPNGCNECAHFDRTGLKQISRQFSGQNCCACSPSEKSASSPHICNRLRACSERLQSGTHLQKSRLVANGRSGPTTVRLGPTQCAQAIHAFVREMGLYRTLGGGFRAPLSLPEYVPVLPLRLIDPGIRASAHKG